MVDVKIRIIFNNVHGIDEKSSHKVRKIIEKQRTHATVKKCEEIKGGNSVKSGEKVPDSLSSIDFRLDCTNEEEMSDILAQIFEEINDVGYEYTYEFLPMTMIVDDGGIEESLFEEIISKKREKGYGKYEDRYVKITDINTKDMVIPIFSLVCSNEDYVPLLFEIIEDFRKFGYSFEVRGF